MNRPQGNDRDPAVNWIAGRDRKIILDRVASLLTSYEWQTMKLFYGIDYEPPETVFRIESAAELDDSMYIVWWQIRDRIDENEDLLKILPDLFGRLKIPNSLEEAGIIKCEVPGHGYSTIEGIPCKGCDCRMEFTGYGARSVEYCSNACRQKAYRRRKKALG